MFIVTPIFRISDYQQAAAFYIDWMGFRIDWEDRPANGPLYMQVSRGSIVLHLAAHEAEYDSCGSMAMAMAKEPQESMTCLPCTAICCNATRPAPHLTWNAPLGATK